jgi:hypothetical protein
VAVFPDRIVLKNSTDDQATIEAAIGAGGTDEIAQGEIVVGVNPTDVKFYTKAGDGSIVSLGGTGTGATTLGELSDVDLSTPATDGQVIAYNTTSGNWEPVDQSGGSSYTDPLTTDGDIVIRSSGVTTRLGIGTSGQVLTVTGGIPSWENATGGATSINDLTDVDTSTTPPTDGQVLSWVNANSQWEPASTSIDDLTDVDTVSVAPTNGQVLEWDGTNWVPADVTGGSAIATTPAPSGPTDTGTAGEIKYDADYIYLAVATNTWKRAALSTWVPAGTIVEVINYTGNGGTQSITGAGFQPGLIFIRKPSSSMYVVSESTSTLGHFLWGNGALVTGGITSLDADGFTLGADADINQSGVNYTALCVKTGQSLASNDGTIQFDYHRIAGCNHGVYTGTGNTSSTYGHGLSVAPEMFVNKRFANAQGYISGNTLGPTGKSLYLNATFFYVNAATYSTLNSTVVSAGNSNVNTSGQESWSLFAENVSNQTACGDVFFGGTVAEEVNLGFTPRFVIFREYTPQASNTTSGQTRELFYYNQTLDSTGNASFLNVSTSSDGVSSALSWTANGFELAVGAGGNDGTTRAMYIAFR